MVRLTSLKCVAIAARALVRGRGEQDELIVTMKAEDGGETWMRSQQVSRHLQKLALLHATKVPYFFKQMQYNFNVGGHGQT